MIRPFFPKNKSFLENRKNANNKKGLIMKRYKSGKKRRGTVSPRKPELNKITSRVKSVGPEKFGILVVDSSKRNYAVRLSNFYGEAFYFNPEIGKTKQELEALISQTKEVIKENGLLDLVVGVENTGSYHQLAKRIFSRHWDIKMIHPFITKQLRQPASLGVKTDDIDLEAMTRAVINGYGTDDPEVPAIYESWRMFCRARKDFVKKRMAIKNRCHDFMDCLMPVYADLFDNFWEHRGGVFIARHYGSAAAILKHGMEGIRNELRPRKIVMYSSTINKIFEWCKQAPGAVGCVKTARRLLRDYTELMKKLSGKIEESEVEILAGLASTPNVILLGMPGINVVNASDYGSELGPISNYINPRRITGRAGLFPSRFQSDAVDHADGPIVGGHNTRLRDSLIDAARSLITNNDYFKGWKEFQKKAHGWNNKQVKFAVASRFSRISFSMLAGNMVYKPANGGKRDSIIIKIIEFCKERNVSEDRVGKILLNAVENIPGADQLLEAQDLERWMKGKRQGGKMLQAASDILEKLWNKVKQFSGEVNVENKEIK